MVRLAKAFNTLTCPLGNDTSAETVKVDGVPEGALTGKVVELPATGISLTVNVVFKGVLVAVRTTGTGLVVPAGNETSAVE